jgi:hypothetical protein
MKKLVYYSVGFNSNYNKLLEISLKTLKLHYTDDILIITDYANSLTLKENEIFNDVIFFIIETPKDIFLSSLNKIKIFDYDKFFEYDVVLYLDCDTIIINNIDCIFEKTIEYNCVAIMQDRNEFGDKLKLNHFDNTLYSYLGNFWGKYLYNNEELLIENERQALNSGVMCIPATQKSKIILSDIYNHGIIDHTKVELLDVHQSSSEQPYINFHLFKNSYFYNIDNVYLAYSIKDDELYNSNFNDIKDYNNENFENYIQKYSILHFYGPIWGSFEVKYDRLLKMYNKK